MTTGGTTTINTRLALALSPASATIGINASTTLTAEIVSTGAPTVPIAGTALEGLALEFAPGTLGSVLPTTGTISNGTASTTFSSGSSYGTTDPSVTLDNGTKATAITILGVPTATAQTASVDHDSSGTSITLAGTDPDTPAPGLSYKVGANPTHGTLSGTAPNLTYTPSAGYHGADSFTFTVSNGPETSASATVTLNVATGTPTAGAQTVAVAHDSTGKTITLTSTDDDSPSLTLTYAFTQPAHGTLSGTAPNLTYSPTPAITGRIASPSPPPTARTSAHRPPSR